MGLLESGSSASHGVIVTEKRVKGEIEQMDGKVGETVSCFVLRRVILFSWLKSSSLICIITHTGAIGTRGELIGMIIIEIIVTIAAAILY